jgi:hypothetical protein
MLHKDEFSVRNGIGNTEDIIPLLKERNQTHFALANYGEVSNWVNQYFNCIKNNIIPILGIETHVNNHKVSGEGKDIVVENIFENWKKNVSEMNEDEKSLVQIDFNLALFASNMDGYYNIIKIHNDAQINGFTDKPKTNDVFLKEHGKGVIAVMPTPFSEVSTLIFNGNWKEAKNKLEFYSSVFDEVYMAITLVEEKEYSEFNDSVIKFCEKFNVKMIPVLNSHYIYPKDESLLDTMNKMQKIKSGVKFEVDLLSKMYYRSYNEVYELWKNVFEDDIFTENVFAKMNFNLTRLLSKFEVLPLDTSPKTPHFENCEQILREKCIEGLKARGLEGNQEYLERMEYELDNIIKAGFADYFVLLEDLCTWCWNNGVHTGTGRGSASGSLVLYLLNITHADPIKYNLLFERFLSADKLQEIIEKGGKVTGCFSGDTIVRLEDDYKYISDIKEGDVVIGSDNKPHKVIRTLYKGVQDTIRIVYELDDKLYYFDCTKGHRVSIIENKVVKDKMICEVSIGDYIYRPDGTKAKIIEKNFYKNQKVYDLEVEENHHYCVCGKELIANKLNNDKLFDNKKIIKINGDLNNGIQRQYYRFD